jgi:hypothetical protein
VNAEIESTEPVLAASPVPGPAGVAAAPAETPRARPMRAVRVGAAAGVLGALVAVLRGPAPAYDARALADALGAATSAKVLPEDVRWGESSGMLGDFLGGRWAMFLASADGQPRDVWRARVRLSPEGHPIEVTDAHNLTQTELGDDHALVVRGRWAAYATSAYGREQSVSLLDLEGEGTQNKSATIADRAMACLTNFQRTGACVGVGRVDVTMETPARAVGLALLDSSLRIDAADDRSVHTAMLDVTSGDLAGPPSMHAEPATHLPKRLSHWAVDTVRAVPWIGPAPIAWLEEEVFALRDDAKKLAFKVKGGGAGDLAVATEPPAATLDTSEASIETAHWPPPRITTIWKSPEAGEGEWDAPKQTWIRKVPGTDASAPSPFYRTFLRPDEERPYAKVLLVAMDTRQLDLEMEAGSEDPRPLTGPTGPGKLPRDPAVFTKVAATFNGGFKTEHGYYGMMVHKRVLLPPQPGAASVVTLKDGRVGLGSWGANKTVSGIAGVADDELVSMRQNLDALVDHGQLNPSGRSLWGYSAPGKGVQTERSGLCVTTAGHLLYAWGDDVSATTLAKAMKMGGCDYGMHLDMNPFHTGFLFTRIEDIKSKRYQGELLSPGMEIPKDRFIEWAPKDFFYVLVHDPTPSSIDGGSAWKADGGSQPAPAWMPGLWASRVEGASPIEMLDVEPGRATWRVRAGAKDAPMATPARELAPEEAKRALVALGLGVADAKHARGLATQGQLAVPMHGGAETAAIVVRDGRLAIVKSAEVAAPEGDVDFAELPLALMDGAVTAEAGAPVARAVLGTTPDGRVLVARGTFASDAPLAEALKRAGCTRAVALDRGSHTPAMLHRAGTSNAPLARYDESVLYAIATPMKPRAFRFDAVTPAPTGKK